MSVEITPDKAEVYWDVLADLTDEQFTVACRRALTEWDKPYALPPIATLLRYASEVAAASGAVVDGESAWAYLHRRTLAKYRPGVATQDPLDWPDQLARQIVREELGGIYAVAVTEGDYAREQLHKRFVASYDRQRSTARAIEGVQPAALPTPLRRVGGGE